MNRIFCVLVIIGCFAISSHGQSERQKFTINENWKFLGEGIAFGQNRNLVNDAAWKTVNLPHTWNANDPFDDKVSYRRGIGWYRKRIVLDEEMKGKRIYLYFEGANQVADVYVNGTFVGEHKGGYTAFSVDITDLVDFKKAEQLVAVSVNNAHDPFIPPLAVGYGLYGGIYRDVWLIATNDIHFNFSDYGSKEIDVSTPEVSNNSASVKISGTVLNDSNNGKKIEITSSIVDATDKVVEQFSNRYQIDSGQNLKFSQDGRLSKPNLWSPDHPYLYTVTTQIKANGKIVDELENPLGFRWFSVDPDSGFSLNGKHLYLRGTNRHQDYKGKGSALSNEIHRSDMEFIKEMGANFVRLAHYPQDPEILRAADELGLLIWEEIPVVDYMNISQEFYQNAEHMLKEMIHQHYNHPSIIIWGSMNEVFLWGPKGARISRQDDPVYAEHVRVFATKLDSVIRAESPYRYSAMAMHMGSDYAKFGIEPIPQIAGFNVYNGWYGGTFDGFGKALDKKHNKFPKQNNFITEYGAGSDQRLNSSKPIRFDFTGQYQRMYHEAYIRQAKSRKYLTGMAIWNQFDFSQPHIGGSIPHLNQKGMATWDRKPKDVYYLYKANWNPDPMIHIATNDWSKRASTDKQSDFNIDVYSNLTAIDFYANQKKIGTKSPNDIKKATWDLELKAGKNILRAVGKTKEGNVIEDVATVYVKKYEFGSNFKDLAVNVGSSAQYIDETGLSWIQDQLFEGSYGYQKGTATLVDRKLIFRESDHDPMFYTYLNDPQNYQINAKKGRYNVSLFFLEPEQIKARERVFDVIINGQKVISDLDLVKQIGIGQGVKKTFDIQTDRPRITIEFHTKTGKPILNGLKIEKID